MMPDRSDQRPQASPADANIEAASDRPTHTRLRGRGRVVARVAWIALTVLTLAVLIAGVPALHAEGRTYWRDVEPEMAQIGLSGSFFVAMVEAGNLALILVFALTAAILFWLRSDDWMVLCVSLTSLMFWASLTPGTSSLIEAQPAWTPLVNLVSILGAVSPIILFYLFPNGRFVPRWTRVATVALIAGSVAWFFVPNAVAIPALTIFLGSGVYAQVYRYRRVSTPVERQQTKWPLLGLLTLITVELLVFVLFAADFGSLNAVALLALFVIVVLALSLLPLSLAVSILRYRLWDIDFLINRSLVYGALTMLLLAFFGVSTFTVSRLFQGFGGGPLVAVAASAGIFGAIFQPARRGLQRFVDRRLYDIEIDYQKTPPPKLAPGEATRVLQGTRFAAYRELEFVARGGMGEVYRATHPTLGRPVAIKLLPAHLVSDPDFRQRFQRESQVASDLRHPNIVRVFDFGEAAGTHYIVMEYLTGSLDRYLRQAGRLPLAQLLPMLCDIANALDYAHAQGLVHRDIKPSNVLLDYPDRAAERGVPRRVVLTDFGTAKILGAHTMLTRTGMILGTLHYVAPEQIQASADVDGRADVYAFGVMAYEMLTGELPFQRNNPGALLMAHLLEPPPDPRERVPELSTQVAQALERALAKSPQERYRSAGAFVQALR